MGTYRNGNYTAFYVDEPFSESNLGANATPDFVYYNMLRMWKGEDVGFPFIDSHNKNYNVRDGSDWESTLKPRLQERLRNSKNIILFLSSVTKNSMALREEIDYGVNTQGLPIIVIYPEHKYTEYIHNPFSGATPYIKNLWKKLPIFRNSMYEVATLHIPMRKDLITQALMDSRFMVQTMSAPGVYFY